MTPERLMCLASARGASLDAVSSGGTPEWTQEDVALGAAGLPRHQFYVALYALAGDDTVRGTVKHWLMEELLKAREALHWAGKVERITGERSRFSEELVELFLSEERRPQIIRDVPILRAIWMRVEPGVWQRSLSHQYAYLSGVFREALVEAEYRIRRKLRRSA